MRLEELERFIAKEAGTPAVPAQLRFAINQALNEFDEFVSAFGGSMGREAVLVDLTDGRDTYPVRGMTRMVHVERLDVEPAPWPLSPTTPGQIAQAAIRGAGGGYWAALDDAVIIYPAPDTTTKGGLRVWGYLSRAIPYDADPETQVDISDKAMPFIVWRSVEAVAQDARMRDRAGKERVRAEAVLRRYIEMPTTGVYPDRIVVEP